MRKYILTEEQLVTLLEQSSELGCLEAAGVDNWPGYEYKRECLDEMGFENINEAAVAALSEYTSMKNEFTEQDENTLEILLSEYKVDTGYSIEAHDIIVNYFDSHSIEYEETCNCVFNSPKLTIYITAIATIRNGKPFVITYNQYSF